MIRDRVHDDAVGLHCDNSRKSRLVTEWISDRLGTWHWLRYTRPLTGHDEWRYWRQILSQTVTHSRGIYEQCTYLLTVSVDKDGNPPTYRSTVSRKGPIRSSLMSDRGKSRILSSWISVMAYLTFSRVDTGWWLSDTCESNKRERLCVQRKWTFIESRKGRDFHRNRILGRNIFLN